MTDRDLRLLPKGHVHLHFEAGMRRSTLESLAAEAGQAAPAWTGFEDFSDFEAAYGSVLALVREPRHLGWIMRDLADDARGEGVVYLEVTVAPVLHAHLFAGDPRSALAELARLAELEERRSGVVIRLMVGSARTGSLEDAERDARMAAEFADRGVVSYGLHGDERGRPASPFAPAFSIARAAGLQVTPHAGELEGPWAVLEALEVLAADRILHGIRVIEDRAAVSTLVRSGVPLDVCITSNLRMHVVEDLAHHPLPSLLAAGVHCSINADDPLQYGSGLLSEYQIAREHLRLDDVELARCARTSIDSSKAPRELKVRAAAAIGQWLSDGPTRKGADELAAQR